EEKGSMGGNVNVLAARFLLTSGHVMATCLALHALPLTGAEGAVVLVALSFLLAAVSLVTGIDIFSPPRNAVHIACHFLGGVMLSRVVLYKLPSAYLWHVVLVAHLPSSCCTLDAARRLFLVRASPHRY
ncbi:hypothetical protein Gpo141_00012280, partial [Globisporangium polare]